jgi:hypothetical protein
MTRRGPVDRVGKPRGQQRAPRQPAQPGTAGVGPSDGAVTFEAVRKIARTLPDAEESTSYGTPAFKVGGELFVRLHQDGSSFVIRTDFEQREELMAADPDTYYITDHYLNYPWILARMSRVAPDALRDLLGGAWRLAAAEKRRKSRPQRRSSPKDKRK